MQKCVQCDTPAEKVLQCGACKSAVYCSKQCQKTDWKGHKPACRARVSYTQIAEKSRVAEFSKVQGYVADAMQATRAHQLFVGELNTHFDAGRFDRVVELQAEAIAVAEALHDDLASDVDDVEPHVRIADIYATLGTAMRMFGDYHKNLEMCRQAVAAVDRVAATMHPCKISYLLKLALALADLRHNEEALSVFRRVEEATLESPDDSRMVVLGAMAGFFVKRDDFVQAIEYYPRVVELSVARGNRRDTASLLNEFAYAVLMAGDAPRAYSLHEESLKLANEVFDHGVMATAVAGLAGSMWAILLSPEIVDDDRERGLVALGKHLSDARRLLESDDAHLYSVYGRVLLLTAFEQHLTGEGASALMHALELLTLMANGSRCRCSSCWQKRDDDHPLVKCSHCRVARFCNRECQEEGSAGRDRTNTRHIVAHRYVCEMLRVQRLVGEAVDAGDATGDLTETLRKLVVAFLRRMTAGVFAGSLASAVAY